MKQLAAVFILAGMSLQETPAAVVRIPAAPTYTLSMKGEPQDLLLRDLDTDGFLDLLVAVNREGPSFACISQKGRFKDRSWTSGDTASSSGIGVGDFNGDGIEDLVLVRYNRSPAVAYAGKGKGKFQDAPFWTAADTEWSGSVMVADFNGDGSDDLLARGYYDKHRIYRGSKAGPSVTTDWQVTTANWASKVAWVDMDGDGRKDLVMSNWQGPAFEVYKGLKADFEKTPVASSARGEFTTMAVADLNGDGFPEIAIGSGTGRTGDGRVRLYANDKGTMSGAPVWWSDDLDANTTELIFADLDKDGDADLFVLAGAHTAVYENRKGTLASAPCWRADVAGGCARIEDLDKDGYPDLIVGAPGKIHFYHGGKDVVPATAEPFPKPPPLAPLNLAEIRPHVDPALEVLIRAYADEKSAEKREKVQEELLRRSGEALAALELLDEKHVDHLKKDLRSRFAVDVGGLIGKLASPDAKVRNDAGARLLDCGDGALAALKTAAEAGQLDAGKIRERILNEWPWRKVPVMDLMGLRLTPITPALQKRYGLLDGPGLVVIAVGDGAGRNLGIGDIREGDVIVGVGSADDYGATVDKTPSLREFVRSTILHSDAMKGRGPADPYCVGLRWRCGPMHPGTREEKRQEQARFVPEVLDRLKVIDADPARGRPGSR